MTALTPVLTRQQKRAIRARRIADGSIILPDRFAGNRPVGQNPGARASTVVHGTGHVKKSSAMKMTGAQKNSHTGRTSEWAQSQEFFTDPKWSQTLSTQMTRGSW